MFGRGGEEALALAEAGVEFQIVPGVSSIAAVPASALIPVTHRGVADRVTIASGHGADGGEPDYAALAAAGGTLVLFMGLERLGAALPTASSPPDCRGTTPAAVVSRGTLPDQEVRRRARSPTWPSSPTGSQSPALVVVGDVVGVGAELAARSASASSPPSEITQLAWSFRRVDNLPPYVFAVIRDLTLELRRGR